jgi:hypothetical protein
MTQHDDRYTVAPFGDAHIILDGGEPREHPSGGLTNFRTAEEAQEVADRLNATC